MSKWTGSKVFSMEQELKLRIVLESPPPGIDFGLQKGGGNDYQTIQTQRSAMGDLSFEFSVRVREGKEGQPNFLGPFVQGSSQERFVYIDIGTYAGQQNTQWSRRLKVPLRTINWELINKGKTLETHIAGTGKDGGPTCATPKPFNGWQVKK
jgi:Family of unknown function (DUF5990)